MANPYVLYTVRPNVPESKDEHISHKQGHGKPYKWVKEMNQNK